MESGSRMTSSSSARLRVTECFPESSGSRHMGQASLFASAALRHASQKLWPQQVVSTGRSSVSRQIGHFQIRKLLLLASSTATAPSALMLSLLTEMQSHKGR